MTTPENDDFLEAFFDDAKKSAPVVPDGVRLEPDYGRGRGLACLGRSKCCDVDGRLDRAEPACRRQRYDGAGHGAGRGGCFGLFV